MMCFYVQHFPNLCQIGNRGSTRRHYLLISKHIPDSFVIPSFVRSCYPAAGQSRPARSSNFDLPFPSFRESLIHPITQWLNSTPDHQQKSRTTDNWQLTTDILSLAQRNVTGVTSVTSATIFFMCGKQTRLRGEKI